MQLPLNIRWNAAAELERFVAGENAEAARLVAQLAEGECPAPALLLHGPAGIGKSHLLQGACRSVTGRGGLAVYLPFEQLLEHGPAMLEGLERAELLALDELDALAGYENWQDAVFYLFSRAYERGCALLLAARQPPGHLPLALPDLRSQLSWGVVVEMLPPGEATCLQILHQRAGERGLELPAATARYLIRRVPHQLPWLLELFDELDRASLAAGRRLTVPFVREVLSARLSPGGDTPSQT